MPLNQGPDHGPEHRVEGKKHGSHHTPGCSFIFETQHESKLLRVAWRLWVVSQSFTSYKNAGTVTKTELYNHHRATSDIGIK